MLSGIRAKCCLAVIRRAGEEYVGPPRATVGCEESRQDDMTPESQTKNFRGSYQSWAEIFQQTPLKAEGGLDLVDRVEVFPAEEADRTSHFFAVTYQRDGFCIWLASHVAVACSRLIDRVLELELLDDLGRAEVEDFSDLFGYLAVLEAVLGGSVGLDVDADRTGYADGV